MARHTEKCRFLPHIWTIMLKLHFIDLLSIYYTSKFATNTVTNRTDEDWAIVYATPASTVGGVIICSRRGWSQSPSAVEIFFLTPQLCIQKIGHVSKTTPFLGWFVIPLARPDIVSLCTKFWRALASAIPEIWMGHQNLKRVTWLNHAPFRTVCCPLSGTSYHQPVH